MLFGFGCFMYTMEVTYQSNSQVSDSLGREMGIFRIKAGNGDPHAPPTFKSVHWVITVDESGSMDDMCKDGHTKAQHVIHTITNLLGFFRGLREKHHVSQKLTLVCFDGEVRSEYYELDDELNFERAKSDILCIHGKGLTNIEGALREGVTHQAESAERTVHMLMTDGQVTEGSRSTETLGGIIRTIAKRAGRPGIYYALLGYGADHDSHLLSELGEVLRPTEDSHSTSEYHYIESYENAGMVYGEAAFNGVYIEASNPVITVAGGEIYDYSKDEWTRCLQVPSIGQGEKTWSVRAEQPGEEVKVKVSYFKWSEGGQDYAQAPLHQAKSVEADIQELERYHMRMRTLSLLHQAREARSEQQEVEPPLLRRRAGGSIWVASPPSTPPRGENDALKNAIDNLMAEIEALRVKHGDDVGDFLRNLKDDLHVARRGLDASNGLQFIAMRHTSQGRQRTYNASDLSEMGGVDDGYEMSQAPLSAYRSPASENVLRTCSQPT
jgi:hypothetical protein